MLSAKDYADLKKRISALGEAERKEALLHFAGGIAARPEPAAILAWRSGVELTKTEGRYLYALSTPVGRTLGSADLIARAHESGGRTIDRKSVNSHIRRLRNKVSPLGVEIEAIYGVGWRIAAAAELDLPWETRSDVSSPESDALDFFLDSLEARRRDRGGT